VAQRRASHQVLDAPCVFPDPLAVRLVSGGAAFEPDGSAPRLRAFLAVRSRIAEDALARAVAAGVRQYVVLGAGMDTFAYRNPHPALRVFEVDHPATQAWKRDRLDAAGIGIPAGVTFVPVDFERQSLAEELGRAGFRAGAPAFFSWLGVTAYLAAAAVLGTLRTVAELTRAGGGIAFDYGTSPESLDPRQRAAWESWAARVAALGERWTSWFEPAALARELGAMGFVEVEDLGNDEINRRWFARRADGLAVGGWGRMVVAMRPIARRGPGVLPSADA
jgi:methyltransferase (TIGR00027 family)